MKKRYNVMASLNSLPVMFPTEFAKDTMNKLESSSISIEDEIERERKYLNHLFHYNKLKKLPQSTCGGVVRKG